MQGEDWKLMILSLPQKERVMFVSKSNPFVQLPNMFWLSFQLLEKRQETADEL